LVARVDIDRVDVRVGSLTNLARRDDKEIAIGRKSEPPKEGCQALILEQERFGRRTRCRCGCGRVAGCGGRKSSCEFIRGRCYCWCRLVENSRTIQLGMGLHREHLSVPFGFVDPARPVRTLRSQKTGARVPGDSLDVVCVLVDRVYGRSCCMCCCSNQKKKKKKKQQSNTNTLEDVKNAHGVIDRGGGEECTV